MTRFLVAAAAVALATACASNPASFGPVANAPQAPASRNAATCPKSVVYVATRDATIDVYDTENLDAKPCGTLHGFTDPRGFFVDSRHNLWVADSLAHAIYKFAPGGASPVRTLSDPNGVPNDVTVDERSGTVYVVDYSNDVAPNTLVEVYAKGSTTPTGTLSDPAGRNGGFGAVDNQGNLYVTFMTQSNTAQVDRWTGGSGTPRNLGLKLVSAGSIVTTATGALAICDPFAYRCGVFEPGSQKMAHVFGHMGRFNDIVPNKAPWLHPDAFALDGRERRAYVASISLSEWAFPGPANRPNHLPVDQIKVPGDAGDGIAVSPASRPGSPY